MNLSRHLLLAALLLAPTLLCTRPLSAQPNLIVISKTDHTLAEVDPATLKVLWTAPVGPSPHEVAISPDNSHAYISNFGGASFHTISVVDLRTHKALPDIDTTPLVGAHGLAFAGKTLWFAAQTPGSVASLDPATGKIGTTLLTHQDHTHMLWVSPDQKKVVVINVSSVTIFEKHGTTWTPTQVNVDPGSEGFDLTPDHKQIWTSNAKTGTISVIDLPGKKLIETFPADVLTANRLKITPDGKFALVTLLNGPDLVVVDTATRKVVRSIPIGHGAAGLLIDAAGNHAYASCGPDNYVAVIDLHTWKVTGHIEAGGNPDGLAWLNPR
ncbi:MAG: YncE family protein [Granulicella sp.]